MSLKPQSYTLSRKRDQRKALLKGLAESLILHESILTTAPKARALRPFVEKLITRAKVNNVANRRILISRLSTRQAVDKLLNELGPRYKDRNGGYTSIKSEGWRRGDDARMSRISLVKEDEPDTKTSEAAANSDTKAASKDKSEAKPTKTKAPAKTAAKPKPKTAGTKTKKSPAKKESA